jgi:DNA primase
MARINKDEVLARLDFRSFYRSHGLEPTNDYNSEEWACLCPFHDDERPSLGVNMTTSLYNCLACGESGDVFTFYQKIHSCDFREALERIAREEVGLVAETPRPKQQKPQPAQTAERRTIPHSVAEEWHQALLANDKALSSLMQLRGYTLDTIKRFKLGYIEKDKRVSIPIYDEAGDLINIRRYSPGGKQDPKFLPYQRGYGRAAWFPIEALQGDEILLLEGEPDTMLAIQLGLPGLCQTSGCETFKAEWVPLFKGKKVWICYDIDQGGASGAERVANALAGTAAEVRVIRLPLDQVKHPKGDFTDYIKEGHTADDVRELMAQAPEWIPTQTTKLQAPVDVDKLIEELPEKISLSEHQDALRRILREVAKKPPTQREAYIGLLKDRFGLSKSALREEIKLLELEIKVEPPIPQPLPEPRRADICLAQDLVDDVFHYCIFLPTNKGEYVPRLVKSDRTLETVPEELMSRLPDDMARWSVDSITPYNVFEWLEGSKEVDARQLFEDLRNYLRQFLWYPDERLYSLIPLWWMATYIYMVFDAIGYLAMVGTKRTGKTLLLDLTEMLAFNARSFSSGSDAYIFRTVEDDRATLLLDEADQLRKQQKEAVNERLEIIRSGYKRSGKVGRIEKGAEGGMTRKTYSTYSPKMIANVTGLEDALEDRVLHIDCQRKPDDAQVREFHPRAEKPTTQLLRNKLYFFGLQSAVEIALIYDGYRPEGLLNREAEIWSGILCVAKYVGQDVHDEVLSLAHANQSRKELREGVESIEAQEIMALWTLVQDNNYTIEEGGRRYWSAGSVKSAIQDQLDWDKMSHKTVSNDLLRLRIIEDNETYKRRVRVEVEHEGRVRKQQVMCYWLDPYRIKRVAELYKVSLDNKTSELTGTVENDDDGDEPW